jgi:hypothetical protein
MCSSGFPEYKGLADSRRRCRRSWIANLLSSRATVGWGGYVHRIVGKVVMNRDGALGDARRDIKNVGRWG